MGDRDGHVGQGHIGTYLRGVRESRRLSLEAVVEMTGALPGSVTKSYLSRMENGLLEPTFPRLYALSQVYGLPIASLAERFEIDLRRRSAPPEIASQPTASLLLELKQLERQGSHMEVLQRVEYLIDRVRSGSIDDSKLDICLHQLRIIRIASLICLDRLHSAKEECENLLAEPDISPGFRAVALFNFAQCCRTLGKFPLAMMAIAVLEQELPTLDEKTLTMGNLVSLKGNILAEMDNPKEALGAFREAVALCEASGDELAVCRHRINYATMLADCDKPREATRQLTTALRHARKSKYDRQIAFALHGLGRILFRLGDLSSAASHLVESNVICRQHEYISLVFCNCYYLWRIALAEDNPRLATAHLRTLRSYVARVPGSLAEVRAFRSSETEGGAK